MIQQPRIRAGTKSVSSSALATVSVSAKLIPSGFLMFVDALTNRADERGSFAEAHRAGVCCVVEKSRLSVVESQIVERVSKLLVAVCNAYICFGNLTKSLLLSGGQHRRQ